MIFLYFFSERVRRDLDVLHKKWQQWVSSNNVYNNTVTVCVCVCQTVFFILC